MSFNHLILRIISLQCRIAQLKLYFLGNISVTFWQTESVGKRGTSPYSFPSKKFQQLLQKLLSLFEVKCERKISCQIMIRGYHDT